MKHLMKGADASGIRWYLGEKPIQAGTSLEILLEVDSKPLWVPVLLVFDYHIGTAFVYWPTAGTYKMRSEVPEGVLFRWPG